MLFIWRKYEDEDLPPSIDIDEFWHNHILDTRRYIEDCSRIFGYYRHHYPYFGLRGPEDECALQVAFDRSNERYLAEFGEEIVEYDPALDDKETDGD
jgi:hypothetical protein